MYIAALFESIHPPSDHVFSSPGCVRVTPGGGMPGPPGPARLPRCTAAGQAAFVDSVTFALKNLHLKLTKVCIDRCLLLISFDNYQLFL